MKYQILKTTVDTVVSLLMLLILLPVLLIIALVIRLDSKGPAIYKQNRVGKSGKSFVMWKFRTMYTDTPVLSTEDMQKQSFDPYTGVGKFLRKTSIDEIPQLVNVLMGQMSLIGPRPALPTQDDVNSLRESAGVHKLKPGMTGLAQVMGRDELPADQKVAYDSEYLQKMSFCFDLKIIYLTFSAVTSARGNK